MGALLGDEAASILSVRRRNDRSCPAAGDHALGASMRGNTGGSGRDADAPPRRPARVRRLLPSPAVGMGMGGHGRGRRAEGVEIEAARAGAVELSLPASMVERRSCRPRLVLSTQRDSSHARAGDGGTECKAIGQSLLASRPHRSSLPSSSSSSSRARRRRSRWLGACGRARANRLSKALRTSRRPLDLHRRSFLPLESARRSCLLACPRLNRHHTP